MDLNKVLIFLVLHFTYSVVTFVLDGNDYPADQLTTINGDLVRIVDNCTIGDASTCPRKHCCTKKDLTYPKDYNGSKPLYELECKPLKKYGEFCYYNPPAEFCPCETRCVSNGFYGHCLDPLTTINNQLVRLVDNCTLNDASSCPAGHCCVKEDLTYPPGYNGTKPAYQLKCDPLKKSGEFCYYNTPPQFCPCATKCASNGFYGHCA